VGTGVLGLDARLGIGGYYRGSSVLISGRAGTGKTTFGAAFVYGAWPWNSPCHLFELIEV
jgi:circadian clock protein KaiC